MKGDSRTRVHFQEHLELRCIAVVTIYLYFPVQLGKTQWAASFVLCNRINKTYDSLSLTKLKGNIFFDEAYLYFFHSSCSQPCFNITKQVADQVLSFLRDFWVLGKFQASSPIYYLKEIHTKDLINYKPETNSQDY